jgi:hypothetical protein
MGPQSGPSGSLIGPLAGGPVTQPGDRTDQSMERIPPDGGAFSLQMRWGCFRLARFRCA